MLYLIYTCRHVSQSVLIEFPLPEVGHSQSLLEQEVWDSMERFKEEASSSIGLCINLGKVLEDRGYSEIREKFTPMVQRVLSEVQPRAILGYATLLWFTSEVK